ncbi:MAG: tetratricopeptide repeat protein [Cytophagales bacterium]
MTTTPLKMPFFSADTSIDHLIQLLDDANRLRINNIPEGIAIAKKVIEAATENEYEEVLAKANNLMGLFLMIIGDYQLSRQYSNEALLYFRAVNDQKGRADAIFNIASTYYKTDDFHQGLQLLLQCLQLYGEVNDYSNKARVLKALGTIYEYFGDTAKAIESYEKCVENAVIANEPNVESNAYNPLSGTYLKLGEDDVAMLLAEKSIAIKQNTKDERGLGFSIYGRGKVYLKRKDFAKALIDFNESLAIHMKMGDRLGEGMVLNKLGRTHFEMGQNEKAILSLEKAVKIGEQFNIKLISYKAYDLLYQVYKSKGDWKLALEYLELSANNKDSAVKAQTQNVIKSYESIYKIEALEREARAQKDFYEIVEQKNVELDSFFYRVSHDLKGPISSLMGLHSLIQYETFEEKAMVYFKMYHSQFTRIHMIVMDLINLTRMKHINENNVEIDFLKIAKDCVGSYIYLENHKNIVFEYDIEENLGFFSQWVIVNTILQNLIENAIKYSKKDFEDSFVSIKIYKEGSFVKISVKDNGNGISEEDQALIFDMFFRANDQTEGTGLGLYILKRAVERLRGEVNLESKVNEGTLFTINLPY